jgi:hypothetical protein
MLSSTKCWSTKREIKLVKWELAKPKKKANKASQGILRRVDFGSLLASVGAPGVLLDYR